MDTLGGSVEEMASGLLGFRAAGVGHVVCMLDPRDVRGVEAFAPVIELVRDGARSVHVLDPRPDRGGRTEPL
jgi:hypothetical protein